jgi:hypothetical protein
VLLHHVRPPAIRLPSASSAFLTNNNNCFTTRRLSLHAEMGLNRKSFLSAIEIFFLLFYVYIMRRVKAKA